MTDSTKRPTLPDLPTFARPPFRACELTAKIWGRSEYGDECMVADMRGWGYLTGLGRALGLPTGEAFAAQVKTAKFIAEAVNTAYAKQDAAYQWAGERDEVIAVLAAIRDGHGPNHMSAFCRDLAAAALAKLGE